MKIENFRGVIEATVEAQKRLSEGHKNVFLKVKNVPLFT